MFFLERGASSETRSSLKISSPKVGSSLETSSTFVMTASSGMPSF
jgi:hypothetical protein